MLGTREEEVLRPEEGQALVEYALIVGFVSVVATLVLQAIGANVVGLLQKAVDAFPT